MNINKQRRFGAVCYSGPLSPPNLHWISTISSAILMLARGTGIQKSFLVPIFALQAPASIISWIKGEYGIWTAFLTLLLRLFFYIPGELELLYSITNSISGSLSSYEPKEKTRRRYPFHGYCWIFGFPAFFSSRQLKEGI